ncbi:MAG: ATP-binding protein [Pseudomonadota bacterium]
MNRAQTPQILGDLGKKLVFLVGPRQVGKTWLAKALSAGFQRPVYLNWDSLTDRRVIRTEGWLRSTDLLVLDEIHGMLEWKQFLKGVFDTKPEGQQILVTGSARLDFIRQGGASLAGRFFVHRLLPFSPSEVAGADSTTILSDPDLALERLLERGGFPEPFLADDPLEAERWRRSYIDGLIREDVLDFERIHDLAAMKTLLELLRRRVGSLVSYQSLSEDLSVSPNTVKKYISILEALYIVFRVTPWSDSVARSLLKAPKLYFYDVGLVAGDEGARFENLVALSLLKHALSLTDRTGSDNVLHYIRTKEGREVDFFLSRDHRPVQLIEAKLSETDFSPALRTFSGSLSVPGVQVVRDLRHERQQGTLQLRRAATWLAELEP